MLNKKLKQLRMEYEITAERLAQFMKVSERDIMDWENGKKEPTLAQIYDLAELFDVDSDDLLSEDDTYRKKKNKEESSKNKTKNKTKKQKKTKTKHKTKKVNNKTVEKKRNWPLIVILIILLAAAAGGGFLYWKYGDEYSLIKKNDYKVEELVGTFSDETDYENTTAELTLASDGSYNLRYHSCSVQTEGYGRWSVDGNEITLKDNAGNEYTLKASSTNKLKLTSGDIGCSPKKNDVFTRGSSTGSDEKEEPQEEEEEPTTYVKSGQWSGNNSTLVVEEMNGNEALFTLQSYDPENAENIAKLSDIKGSVNSNTVTFSFEDDGFGNAGEGSIVFDKSTAVFQITKTKVNEEAAWSIIESGTLYQ